VEVVEPETIELSRDFSGRVRGVLDVGFYPAFTDTSKKPIMGKRSVYVQAKKVQP
jgi:hypothetical protein